jgi:hypothetical protein
MAAWNGEPEQFSHAEVPPFGVTVPVYFSLGTEPAGHVAIRLSDGWVASSTLSGKNARPYYHKSLDDLIAVYGKYNGGCRYLGWGEHVGSQRVVEWVADNATADQVKQAYRDILEREADSGAIVHYQNYTNDFVRQDLLNSQEYKNLQALKAAQAKATAEAQAKVEAQAKADAEAKAKDEAEAKAREEALKNQPPAQPVPPVIDYGKENNDLLKWIVNLLKTIFNVK